MEKRKKNFNWQTRERKTIAGFSVEKGEMEEEERGRGNDSLAVDLFP